MTPSIKQRIDQIRWGEVPKGYVKTRVGVLPIQWETRALSSYLSESFVIGNTGNVAKKITVKLWNKGVVAKKEIHRGSENTRYYKRKKGQLIYSKLDFLNCAFGIIPESLDGFESTQDLPAFDIEGVDPVFLLSQIVQKRFYERWGTMVANGGRKARRISEDDFLSFPIAVPPIEEQRKIAAILTAQDKVIELKERLLAEKQRQKAYLMQQLLTGKKRLPGFSGAWRTERLGKLFLERKETNCEGLEMLAITGTQGIIPRKELDLKDNSSDDKSKYLKVCVGDIGYNTMRMWQGNSAYSNYEGIVSPAYTILKPSASVDAKYFAYLFKMPEIIFLFYRFSQGLVDDTRNLKYENFKKIKVFYPPEKKEQTAITEVLSATDCEIDLLRQDVEQEKQRKKALMHLLLTGIVRVKYDQKGEAGTFL